jgi:rhodanese-related sulfurtransferase
MSSTTTPRFSLVTEHAAADPEVAEAHFTAKLAFETDPADVHADLTKGMQTFLLVDARSPEAYADGHLPGALNLPSRSINADSTIDLPRDRVLVTYCWGPGCNGSTKAAQQLASLGFPVKELIGGIEYWQREGYEVER